jgi:D-lactate dehydratase
MKLIRFADSRAKGVWDDYHVVQGRVVTGMNPQSARSTAIAVLEQFKKLEAGENLD